MEQQELKGVGGGGGERRFFNGIIAGTRERKRGENGPGNVFKANAYVSNMHEKLKVNVGCYSQRIKKTP